MDGRTAHIGNGADAPTRTGDLLITNQLLYQLSYISIRAPREADYTFVLSRANYFTVRVAPRPYVR